MHITDFNECELDMDQCAINATCSNTEGSYECSCNTGFTGDGTLCCMWLIDIGRLLCTSFITMSMKRVFID